MIVNPAEGRPVLHPQEEAVLHYMAQFHDMPGKGQFPTNFRCPNGPEAAENMWDVRSDGVTDLGAKKRYVLVEDIAADFDDELDLMFGPPDVEIEDEYTAMALAAEAEMAERRANEERRQAAAQLNDEGSFYDLFDNNVDLRHTDFDDYDLNEFGSQAATPWWLGLTKRQRRTAFLMIENRTGRETRSSVQRELAIVDGVERYASTRGQQRQLSWKAMTTARKAWARHPNVIDRQSAARSAEELKVYNKWRENDPTDRLAERESDRLHRALRSPDAWDLNLADLEYKWQVARPLDECRHLFYEHTGTPESAEERDTHAWWLSEQRAELLERMFEQAVDPHWYETDNFDDHLDWPSYDEPTWGNPAEELRHEFYDF